MFTLIHDGLAVYSGTLAEVTAEMKKRFLDFANVMCPATFYVADEHGREYGSRWMIHNTPETIKVEEKKD
jgi:hypothetical protein